MMLLKLPNILTLSRIGAIPVLVATFYIDLPLGNWLGLAVLVLAGLTDFFDGYFARAWAQQSMLGRFLDPIADKLLVSALILMLVFSERIASLAVLPAIVILCREILVSGLREFLAGVRIRVPVSRLAQWKTTLQMIALGFLIVGPAGPQFGPVSTTQIGDAGLWLAAVLTLVTGYDYLRAGLTYMDDAEESAHDTKSANKRVPASPKPARDLG